MTVCEESLAGEVQLADMASGERAYQLERLASARSAITRQVNRRHNGKALPIDADYRATRALTLAQVLVQLDRYDPRTGRYHRSDQGRLSGPRSMLTEEALDALLDAIEGFDRLILVGDPRQLPPIGVGRPFVDIVGHLRDNAGSLGFPRVGRCYAELTVPRRQAGGLPGSASTRDDLIFADWFAGGEMSPDVDEAWEKLGRGEDLSTISVRQWTSSAHLSQLIRSELASSLPHMSDVDDSAGFEKSCGAKSSGDYNYFNLGAAEVAEQWQVLSPVRAAGGAVGELNRLLQNSYRKRALTLARIREAWSRKIPRPAGPQEIVYGDRSSILVTRAASTTIHRRLACLSTSPTARSA